ncbi:MAG: exodeoxyribonuclease VII large subunit [Rhodobiaceae bacterium]|nr:exodeoxyribonuclease VII large subunit [Rhodobiaceae bacterium]
MTAENSNLPEYTVGELAGALKRTVEENFAFVRLRGEISGFRGPHSSGHAYFTLKDADAVIDAVVWRGTYGRLRFKPEEGLEVIATGKVTTYPRSSKYQIVIEALEPAGEGALMALLEARRRQLQAEGLFDPARKQPLPRLPAVIGVITSPTGSVIRDILHRIADRFPVRVLVWPARVQGEGSAEEVARGIEGFNRFGDDPALPRPDIIIVARGGGSLEDLWAFNEEVVVRAAAASHIPLISAVGHETDTTLIDHAADMRAPTPTAAAEMAVPVRSELLAGVADLKSRLLSSLSRHIKESRALLQAAVRGLPRPAEIIALARQRHDHAGARLSRALGANVAAHRALLDKVAARLSPGLLRHPLTNGAERLAGLWHQAGRAVRIELDRRSESLAQKHKLLRALSYVETLARGFALVRDADDAPVTSAAGIAGGAALTIQFADGEVRAVAGGGPASRSVRGSPKKQGGQTPDLFGDDA